MRGARQAGPEPARAAIGRRAGQPVLAAGQPVEVDRQVQRDGHLMHAIAGGALAGTWPCPVTAEREGRASCAGS